MIAAGAMSRERAKIVVVGLVPFGLPREIAYAKELELRISRSYGPGRYDAAFEEKGIDYPAGATCDGRRRATSRRSFTRSQTSVSTSLRS
jgi:hypothetical protein